MGVPGLFSYLRKYNKRGDRYSTIKSSLPDPYEPIHLYLDFNGAIYQVLNPDIKTNETFILYILEYLDNLLKIFSLKHLTTNNPYLSLDDSSIPPEKDKILVEKLFIAIDGVPPRAKMEQQRQRRFHSVCRKNKMLKIDNEYGTQFDKSSTNEWIDTNMITPGTTFMQELKTAILNHIESDKDGIYKHMEVIFNDWTRPGEGEHKIKNYLMKYPTPQGTKTVIYGLDGDLIMLSMSTRLPNLYLLREAYEYGKYAFEHQGYPYLFMDIDCFKLSIMKELIPTNSIQSLDDMSTKDMNRFIDDYIVLTMMLGNDFLPKIYWMTIKMDGHDILLKAYFQVQNAIDFSIDKDAKWLYNRSMSQMNVSFLRNLLSILSQKENNLMIAYLKKRAEDRIFFPKNITERERRQILVEFLPLTKKEWLQKEQELQPKHPKWRSRYYSLCHRINTYQNSLEIFKIAHDYLKTLLWNARYYMSDSPPSWSWYYPHSYSPTLKDLFNVLDSFKTLNHIKFTKGKPTDPQTLLCVVLPKHSSQFMARNVRQMILSNPALEKIYFPKNYAINIPFHVRYYECSPIIPKIDIELTEKRVHRCKLSTEENNRNQVCDVYYKMPGINSFKSIEY